MARSGALTILPDGVSSAWRVRDAVKYVVEGLTKGLRLHKNHDWHGEMRQSAEAQLLATQRHT